MEIKMKITKTAFKVELTHEDMQEMLSVYFNEVENIELKSDTIVIGPVGIKNKKWSLSFTGEEY